MTIVRSIIKIVSQTIVRIRDKGQIDKRTHRFIFAAMLRGGGFFVCHIEHLKLFKMSVVKV